MSFKIFNTLPHEAQNKLEVSLAESYVQCQPHLVPPFPLTIPSSSQYHCLNQALLYAILTLPQSSKIHLTHLHAIVIDGYDLFVTLLLNVTNHSYHKVVDRTKAQLLWVTSELLNVSAIGVEKLLISLLRQTKGGDFSYSNLQLCEEILRMLLHNWEWILSEPEILTGGLFVYMRLLSDHYRLVGPTFEALKKMEIEFCVRVLRECFSFCLQIGRDLIRLLQDLVYIAEFQGIWKDLLIAPAKFGVLGFESISQIYKMRTPEKYFLLRVTPEMESKVRFLLSQVKWGTQKRYQVWFASKFLCGPEKETIISDLVRFICCAHHPSNEILQSNVISRWAVVGWLLKCCRNNHVEGNAKLALFYDWLFFDERRDNIMNIEPAILLIMNSVPRYMEMTHGLLEFLFLLVDNYDLDRKDLIAQGVRTSFNMLIRKGVIGSLETLISCSSLSPSLKGKLMAFYPSFGSEFVREIPKLPGLVNKESGISLNCRREDKFSAKEGTGSMSILDDGPTAKALEMEKMVHEFGRNIKQSMEMDLCTLENILFAFANADGQGLDGEGEKNISLSPEALACQITDLFKMHGYEMFPGQLDSCDGNKSATAMVIRSYIFSRNDRMKEMFLFWCRKGHPVGAHLLSYTLRLAKEAQKLHAAGKVGNRRLMNQTSCDGKLLNLKDANLESSFTKFHIDMYLSCINDDRYSRNNASNGLVAISNMNDLLVDQLVEGAFRVYRSFLQFSSQNLPSSHTNEVNDYPKAQILAKLLLSDVKSCYGWVSDSAKLLFRSIFLYLSDISTSNEDLIRFFMDVLDHAELVTVQFEVGLRRFSIFGDDMESLFHLVKNSFKWDFVAQQKFWGLLVSELVVSKVQVEKLVKDVCANFLEWSTNFVVRGGLWTLMRSCSPTVGLVGVLLYLPNGLGDFAASVLASWVALNFAILFDCLTKCVEELDNSPICFKINYSVIAEFLNFLDSEELSSTDVRISQLKRKLAKIMMGR